MGLTRGSVDPWADWTSPFAPYGRGDRDWPPRPEPPKNSRKDRMAKDHKITLTIKGTGDFDHPWLVFGGDDVAEVHNLLSQAHEQDLFTAAGRAHAAFLRGAEMGKGLDAKTIKVEANPDAEQALTAQPAATSAAPAAPAAEPEAAPVAAPPIPEGAPKPAWMKG